MRNISCVLDEILKIIPEDHKSLRDKLSYISEYAKYLPPELPEMLWDDAHTVMAPFFFKPPAHQQKWIMDMLAIWRNDPKHANLVFHRDALAFVGRPLVESAESIMVSALTEIAESTPNRVENRSGKYENCPVCEQLIEEANKALKDLKS